MLHALYRKAPTAMQCMATALYGYHLRRQRFGEAYRQELAELQEDGSGGPNELRALRESRLHHLIDHALKHVPYYRQLARERGFRTADVSLATLSNFFPPLDRDAVRENPYAFYSEGFTDRDVRVHSTSGTSGRPLRVRVSREALQRNYAFLADFLIRHGAGPFSRSATFAGRSLVPGKRDRPPFWRPNPAMNDTLFSAYHLAPKYLPYYIDKLEEINPVYIDAYPSAIYEVAAAIVGSGQQGRIKPRFVMTSSETLLPNQRKMIERAFSCPVRDQYGAVELSAFIAEHQDGLLHAHPAFGLLELENDREDTSGSAVSSFLSTGFLNLAMPLIRYRIGDLIEPAEPDNGEAQVYLFHSIVGRRDDVILTPDGRRVGRLGPVFRVAEGIADCQIIQDSEGRVRLRAILHGGCKESDLWPVVAALRERVGEHVSVSVELVDELTRTRGGKFRPVISLLTESAPR